MCGIAGFAGKGSLADLERMTRAVAHRGPDGEGFWSDPQYPVHLGHRRLAIVDIADGAQPMWDAAGEIGVVYNGEIYNHLDLRRELQRLGHRFRTHHSDTEVLIHGWREWGRDLPRRLNGMFAFAIWDRRSQVLFLTRDRFGEKPLYYAAAHGLFLFGSELSAIAAHRGFVARIDDEALLKLMAYGFIPAPRAFYAGAAKIPAGHWLEYRPADRRIAQGRYFSFRIEPDECPPPFEAAAEEIASLLKSATTRRLMSDVPLGVFLSGGIDSSSIAACAVAQGPVETFAIGFTEPSYDESPYARLVAAHLGTRHHERVLSLDEARDLIPEVLGRLDEPFADPSILPTYLLCRFTRERVKVALSGDGGDELFAGYDTFAALPTARLLDPLLSEPLRQQLLRLVELLPKSPRNMSLDFKLRRFLGGVGRGATLWHPLWLAPVAVEAMAALLGRRVDLEDIYAEAIAAWRESGAPTAEDRAMEFYVRFYLQDDILPKVDRAAMLNGLETRAVFLDPDLVDFARRLPASYKIRGASRKRVLKAAMRRLLPQDVLKRPKKGFGIPLAAWLRHLPPPALAAIAPQLDAGLIARWHGEHRGQKADHRLALWSATVVAQHRLGRAA
jgi:asparagine synthase (glutamine-hydrolysing)